MVTLFEQLANPASYVNSQSGTNPLPQRRSSGNPRTTVRTQTIISPPQQSIQPATPSYEDLARQNFSPAQLINASPNPTMPEQLPPNFTRSPRGYLQYVPPSATGLQRVAGVLNPFNRQQVAIGDTIIPGLKTAIVATEVASVATVGAFAFGGSSGAAALTGTAGKASFGSGLKTAGLLAGGVGIASLLGLGGQRQSQDQTADTTTTQRPEQQTNPYLNTNPNTTQDTNPDTSGDTGGGSPSFDGQGNVIDYAVYQQRYTYNQPYNFSYNAPVQSTSSYQYTSSVSSVGQEATQEQSQSDSGLLFGLLGAAAALFLLNRKRG